MIKQDSKASPWRKAAAAIATLEISRDNNAHNEVIARREGRTADAKLNKENVLSDQFAIDYLNGNQKGRPVM